MRYEMKAWILHGIGDIRLETVKKPEPGVGEALVAVKAVGICGSDIPRIYQTGVHVHPLIPGHEFSVRCVDRAACGRFSTDSLRGMRTMREETV